MNDHKDWTRQDLDAIFNRNAQHLEAIAREMPDTLHSVDVVLDDQTRKPVINFVFGAGTAPDLHQLPPQIGGHDVKHRFAK